MSGVGEYFTYEESVVGHDDVERSNVIRIKDEGHGSITEAMFAELTSHLNKSETVSFYGCFRKCSNLVKIEYPIDFDTSKVRDMSFMFNECSKLTCLDLRKFDTSKVTDMSSMFKVVLNLSA